MRYSRPILHCTVLFIAFVIHSIHGQSQEPTVNGADFETRASGLVTAETERAIQRGLQFLAERQDRGGAFGNRLDRNIGVVSLAGMSFLASGSTPRGGPYQHPVERCLDYVLHHSQANGFLATQDPMATDSMYGHGFGTLFLAECYGTSSRDELKPHLERAVELIVQAQHPQGGWRYEPQPVDADISVTACQLVALRAARNAGVFVPTETIDRGVGYVLRCQNEDGGFAYQEIVPRPSGYPRSASALVALYAVARDRETTIQRGWQFLSTAPPIASVSRVDGYHYYACYYAAQAYWQRPDDAFLTWYPPIRDWLLNQQQADASWSDPNSTAYATAMATLVLQVPSNSLPIFRR